MDDNGQRLGVTGRFHERGRMLSMHFPVPQCGLMLAGIAKLHVPMHPWPRKYISVLAQSRSPGVGAGLFRRFPALAPPMPVFPLFSRQYVARDFEGAIIAAPSPR
jgi:hypothetical protein